MTEEDAVSILWRDAVRTEKQFKLMEQAAYGWFKGQFMLKRKQVNPVSYVHGLIALKKNYWFQK
jgi:hypothetical protein